MRTRLALGVAAVALGLFTATAGAHDHRPPKAFLETNAGEQPGLSHHSEWARGDGRSCVVGIGEGPPRWEDPVRFAPGERLGVRFEKRQRPSRVRVLVWRVGAPIANQPLGPPEQLQAKLSPTSHGGRRMWRVEFEAPASAELYLDVSAHWPDLDGCGPQSMSWTFYARVF